MQKSSFTWACLQAELWTDIHLVTNTPWYCLLQVKFYFSSQHTGQEYTMPLWICLKIKVPVPRFCWFALEAHCSSLPLLSFGFLPWLWARRTGGFAGHHCCWYCQTLLLWTFWHLKTHRDTKHIRNNIETIKSYSVQVSYLSFYRCFHWFNCFSVKVYVVLMGFLAQVYYIFTKDIWSKNFPRLHHRLSKSSNLENQILS